MIVEKGKQTLSKRYNYRKKYHHKKVQSYFIKKV